MKIRSVITQNIGGLADGLTFIPDAAVVALAGANGSGKSKFLACLKAPWTRQIPASADADSTSFVEISMSFTENEVAAQNQYSAERGLGSHGVPDVTIRVTQSPLAGAQVTFEPTWVSWIGDMLMNEDVLRRFPSLDFVYIPAERRLSSYGGPFTLVSINPIDNVRSAAAVRAGYDHGGVGMEDYEFEDYARTLCIAAYLPDDHGDFNDEATSAWKRFVQGVDGVLAPKRLLPLTQNEPSVLRVALPDGSTHTLEGLSSGERQALIIISRIFRAGEGHTMVAIDEPDAYLHPSLSTKMLEALRLGLPDGSGLIAATHSPAILDSIDPQSILRFQHGALPRVVIDEFDRIELYRASGFRASALTQSDLLVVTEGTTDGQILRDLIPELTSASIHAPGGRSLVFRDVTALAGLNLPILGVVDADVLADPIPTGIQDNCFQWPVADIEGVLLSDDTFLQAAFDSRLFLPEFKDLDSVKAVLVETIDSFEDWTVSELAIRRVRIDSSPDWPSPKDTLARQKLEVIVAAAPDTSADQVEIAFIAAQSIWDQSTSRLTLVRGKYVLQKCLRRISPVGSSDSFIRAALAAKPDIPAIAKLRSLVRERLESSH